MILEPLSFPSDSSNAFGSFHIFHRNYRFVSTFLLHRIMIHFNETIYYIYSRSCVSHPTHRVVVKVFQIATFVEFNQSHQSGFLNIVLRYSTCFFEPINYFIDSSTVHSSTLPYFLHHLTVLHHQLRIQTPHRLFFHILLNQASIIGFRLFLSNTFVEISSRSFYNINIGAQINSFGCHFWVEDNWF